MLYLVHPARPLRHAETSLTTADIRARLVDAGRLEWHDADLERTPGITRLALRHGLAVSDGIILDGDIVEHERRPDELAGLGTGREYSATTTGVFDAILAANYPEWRDDSAAAATPEHAIDEARTNVNRLLDARIDWELAAHWMVLSGAVTPE